MAAKKKAKKSSKKSPKKARKPKATPVIVPEPQYDFDSYVDSEDNFADEDYGGEA